MLLFHKRYIYAQMYYFLFYAVRHSMVLFGCYRKYWYRNFSTCKRYIIIFDRNIDIFSQ